MIITEHNVTANIDQAPRNGNGENYSKQLIGEEYFEGKINGFYVNALQSNSSIGIHQHDNNQEVYYILSGVGEYFDNGKWTTVAPGDLLLCNKEEKHALKNVQDSELKFIAFIVN